MGIAYDATSGSENITFNGDTKVSRNAAGLVSIGSGAADDAAISTFLELSEITAPSNPATDKGRIYVKDDGGVTKLYFKDSAGTETNLLAMSEEFPGGSDGQIQYNNGGTAFGGAAQMYWDDANNRLTVGASSGTSVFNVVSNTSNGLGTFTRYDSVSASNLAVISLRRARGSFGSESTVADGDRIGAYLFSGHDGTDFRTAGGIYSIVDGTVSASNVPAAIEFRTNDGTSTSERVRITAAGAFSTGGEDAPDVGAGGICINTPTANVASMTFKNPDIAHGMTDLYETDTYGIIRMTHAAPQIYGGLSVMGYTEHNRGLYLAAAVTTPDTGESDSDSGAVGVNAYKKSGTTVGVLADDENAFSVRNSSSLVFLVKGGGNVYLPHGGLVLADTGLNGSDVEGAIEYDGTNFRGFDGSIWVNLDTQGVSSAAGSDGQIQYNNGGTAFGGAAQMYWDDANNRLGIGTDSPLSDLDITGAAPRAVLYSFGDQGFFSARRANGTVGSPTQVISGNALGGLTIGGYHSGGAYSPAQAHIYGKAVGDWTATSRGIAMYFQTTPDGTIVSETQLIITDDGKLSTGGETAPDVDPGGMCLNHGAADNRILTFKNSDVAHSFTTNAEADTYGSFGKAASAGGGLSVMGLSDSAGLGVHIDAYAMTANTGETSVGVINLNFGEHNGATSAQAIGNTEVAVSFRNYDTVKAAVMGSGDIITQAGLKIGSYGQTETAGAIEYDGTNFKGYHDGAWVYLDTQGVASAAGSDGQIQYNNGGTDFGGDADLVWDDTNHYLVLGVNATITTGGETSPDVDPGGLCLNQGANDGKILSFKSSDIAHSITAYHEADTYGFMQKLMADTGGLQITAMTESSGNSALYLEGIMEAAMSGYNYGVINLNVHEHDGSNGVQPIGDGDTMVSFRNTGSINAVILGDGSFWTKGSIFTGGETADTNLDSGGICINTGAGDSWAQTFKSSDVSHGFDYLEADTYGGLRKQNGTAGGLEITGVTEGSVLGVHIVGLSTTASTSDTYYGTINLGFSKHDGGTGSTNLADGENAVSFYNLATWVGVIKGDGSFITAGDLQVASDKYTYWGDRSTDGSWRFGRSGDDMILQKRESGTWNTKHTFGD